MPHFKKKFACALLPLWAACLPASAASDACKDNVTASATGGSEKETVGEKIAEVTCVIKHVFQSRVRYRKTVEPIEMTVGSPPMMSDDTGTPGDHKLEMNFIAQGDYAGDTHRIDAPLLDMNYGLGELIQLKLEIPYVHLVSKDANAADPQSVTRAHGVGDSTFGVKYRFYDDKESGLSFALYPQVRFRTPGANRAVSDQKTVVILPLLMTREFEKASITLNAGVEHGDNSRLFASFGAGTRLSDQLAVFGEIVGTNLNARDERQILLNVGVKRKLSETRSIAASIGHDIHAGGDQPLHRYFLVSFQQLFGE